MLNIRIAEDKTIPILQSLPFQLGILSMGIFVLAAFGSVIVMEDPRIFPAGLTASFFDLFIVLLIFAILIALNR